MHNYAQVYPVRFLQVKMSAESDPKNRTIFASEQVAFGIFPVL